MPCPPGSGPCLPYELNLTCLSPSGTLPSDPCNILDGEPVSQEIIDNATLIASQLLWSLTGRQFSVCQATIRPCRPEDCDQSFSGYEGYPYYPVHQADGTWINQACGCQGNSCSCENLCEVRLPYPVCSVDEVKIDGEILSSTEYKVLDFERLVYSPSATGVPGGCWPRCNQLSKPDTEVGTWSVTLTYGRPVPELVLLGASEMACEIIKSLVGKPCKLPQRVSSITRQGVSVSFLDTMTFLGEGLTGLYFVDLAIKVHNPKRLTRKPAVYSPDVKGQWTVETWKYGDPISVPNPGGIIDGGNP